MHERLFCDGTQSTNRTSGYFEYPSVVAMLLREVRYGVNLGYGALEIDPFGPRRFDLSRRAEFGRVAELGLHPLPNNEFRNERALRFER